MWPELPCLSLGLYTCIISWKFYQVNIFIWLLWWNYYTDCKLYFPWSLLGWNEFVQIVGSPCIFFYYETAATQANLFKWWSQVGLWHVYGKVRSVSLCFCMGKTYIHICWKHFSILMEPNKQKKNLDTVWLQKLKFLVHQTSVPWHLYAIAPRVYICMKSGKILERKKWFMSLVVVSFCRLVMNV